MRVAMILLAFASLSACQSEPAEPTAPEVAPTPAAITFDGAEATDPAARLAHGKRLAAVLGCQGCHGKDLQGTNVTDDEPDYGDMNAPNLTLLLASYSDAQLDQVIRHGVPKDGRTFWFMPSETYQYLSDADLAALVAHLRTIKPAGKPLPPIRKGPRLEKEIAAGIAAPAPEMIRRHAAAPPPDMGDAHAFGRRLVQQTCAGCHNSALQGYPDFSPDLDIAGVYSAAELETLLTTGKGKSKPDLGLMAKVAREDFVRLTPRERAAVIAYVKARAERPQ